MNEQKNDWLESTDKGADITLSKPLNIAGANVNVLSMREPTVADQMASDSSKGGDGDKEVALFANLCMITPEEVKALRLRDYKRLQTAYMSFLD